LRHLSKIFKVRESSLAIVIIAFIAILSFTTPSFLTKINLYGMLFYIAENLIIIGAITIIIISGNFDLSVGSVVGFSGILVGVLIQKAELPIPLAIVLTLVVAVIIGLLNGSIIAYVGVNPFIATLATWFVLLSLKYIINNGNHVNNLPDEFSIISQYRFLSIPLMVYIAFAFFLIFEFLLRKTVYFRQNYFIGGNSKAAILVGIKVRKVITLNYMLVAVMAAIAGILSAARFGNAYTSAGTDTAFILVIAVIVGGASLYGGKGSVLGSAFGLVFMSLIYNSIIMYRIDLNWNLFAIGLLIIIAVTVDVILENRKTTLK
jgi:ribose transport system permease protein